jgi:hypothetical protein
MFNSLYASLIDCFIYIVSSARIQVKELNRIVVSIINAIIMLSVNLPTEPRAEMYNS